MPDTTQTLQEARQDLYDCIRDDGPFEDKTRSALELGVEYLNVDNGHLTRIDQRTDHWETLVSTDPPDGQFPPGLELDLETTYCRRTIETNESIALHDAPDQGWADDPAFETHGLHCYHGTPLVLDSDPYGTVCFVASEPREQFSDAETIFAELIARLLERELERAQHETQLTRQTNLATVLNRVLRHNLRNDLAIIRGFTQLMADEVNDDSSAEIALDTIDDLIGLSQKARELDQVIAANAERKPTDITELVEDVAGSIAQEYPNASISVESDEAITAAVFPSFERAVNELIDNAAKHGGDDPTVTVTIELAPNAVEIRIADTGPGLADHEADVLETGTETPLTHGTGLGLWLTHWIVTSHDGSIEATVTDEGTTMTVAVPRKPASSVHQELTELRRARDQYQAAFEEANDAMVLIDDDARIIDANPEASTIYGLEQQALLGQPFQRFLPDGFDFEAAWREFRTGETERETVTIVDADGVERQVEYSATTDIVPGQHLVISRDVTERERRERRFEAIFNNTYEFMGLLDPAGRILEVNEPTLSFGGLDREAVVGEPIWETAWFQGSAETNTWIREAVERAAEGEFVRTELTVQGADRESIVDFSIRPVTDDGDVTFLVPEGRVITQLKETGTVGQYIPGTS